MQFQPALPMRGVTTYEPLTIVLHQGFQPALPMRGVTNWTNLAKRIIRISTRTPHAGSDDGLAEVEITALISTRTPHAGSDLPP